MFKINSKISIPLSEIQITYSKSSGPGGQNVNKLNTKAYLRWNLIESEAVSPKLLDQLQIKLENKLNVSGELLISSDRYRSQLQNTSDCYDKFREMINKASSRPKRRRPTKVPNREKEKRLIDKKSRAHTKDLRKKPSSE